MKYDKRVAREVVSRVDDYKVTTGGRETILSSAEVCAQRDSTGSVEGEWKDEAKKYLSERGTECASKRLSTQTYTCS